MGKPRSISQPIIEALYCEALVLADEVRSAFDLAPSTNEANDLARIALSAEGLRTTTRMMHLLAWLLNQRAYHAGELSEFQLRRNGYLPPDRPSDPANLAYFEPETCSLIRDTEAMHLRVSRLDKAWRDRFAMRDSAVRGFHEKLGREMGA